MSATPPPSGMPRLPASVTPSSVRNSGRHRPALAGHPGRIDQRHRAHRAVGLAGDRHRADRPGGGDGAGVAGAGVDHGQLRAGRRHQEPAIGRAGEIDHGAVDRRQRRVEHRVDRRVEAEDHPAGGQEQIDASGGHQRRAAAGRQRHDVGADHRAAAIDPQEARARGGVGRLERGLGRRAGGVGARATHRDLVGDVAVGRHRQRRLGAAVADHAAGRAGELDGHPPVVVDRQLAQIEPAPAHRGGQRDRIAVDALGHQRDLGDVLGLGRRLLGQRQHDLDRALAARRQREGEGREPGARHRPTLSPARRSEQPRVVPRPRGGR